MEESSVRIDALGRIQIPKNFRKSLGMEIGDTVNLAILRDCIVVQKNTQFKEENNMDKYVCLIFVRHKGVGQTFLFSVDPMTDIKKGTELAVDTIKGRQKGVAVSDSFIVSEKVMQNIVDGVGAYLPLRPVVGIVKKVTEERVVPLAEVSGGHQL